MTITYSCIANGRAVLAELALTGGSYQVPAGPRLRPRGLPRDWRPPSVSSGRGAAERREPALWVQAEPRERLRPSQERPRPIPRQVVMPTQASCVRP